jgi:WD40 repeat protein
MMSYHQYKLKAAPSFPQRADWGEAVTVSSFYGREEELATLERWLLNEQCRLVALLGMGGVGKTTLALKFAQQVAAHFDFVLWRSLRNATPPEEFLTDCLQTLSQQEVASLPQSFEERLELLIDRLRKMRTLLVFDNVEALLQAERLEGRYREGYGAYGTLFQGIVEAARQSCLLLTSREMPGELAHLEGTSRPVRTLRLSGMERASSQELLQDKRLKGTELEWDRFINYYSGNPLALKMAGAVVRDLFGRDLAAFLSAGPVTPLTLQQVLDQQFQRLSVLERDTMYWLAIERDRVALKDLCADFIGGMSKRELLKAVQPLRRRSLIERGEQAAVFTLQPVVMEYVSERLVRQVAEEIIAGNLASLSRYALMKAQSSDYIRECQTRLLVQPVLEQLLAHFGDAERLEQHLLHLVHLLRELPYDTQGYAGGNIVNLLVCLKGHIRSLDFSHLVVRQAYLRGIEAKDASFARADVTDSRFTEPLDSIASMVLSPDGKYLAVGGFGGQIRVWLVSDGKPLMTIKGHSRIVWALAFSLDSQLLASGGYDRSVKLWDVSGGEESGRCLRVLHGHDKWIRSISFSPDGTLLASSGDDETIRIWDAHNGECLHILRGYTGTIWALTFSPDSTLLATTGYDGNVRLWNARNGTCLHILQGHSGTVLTVAFHPSGDMFASGGEDGRINLWDVKSGQCLETLHTHTKRAASISFNPEGTTLACGTLDGMVEIWKIAENRRDYYRIRTLQGHTSWVSIVSFGPGGLLASTSYDEEVKLWNVESGKCLRVFQGYNNVICTLAFSPNGKKLVHGDVNGFLKVWGLEQNVDGRDTNTFRGHPGRVWSIAFCPDGKTFASGGDDLSIHLWDVSTRHCLQTLHGHPTIILSLAFSPDGSLLAGSSFDNTIRLWQVGKEEEEGYFRTLQGHTEVVWSVVFSPDGKMLASSGNNGEIKLWDIESGQCLATLHNDSSPVGALAFSSDGKTVLSGNIEGSVVLWEVSEEDNKHCLKTLQGQSFLNWIKAMTFSQDGTTLATGGNEQTVKLWYIKEEETTLQPSTFSGHGGLIWSVAFSMDNRLLASGDDEGIIAIWDVQTGTYQQILRSDRPYERMNISQVKGISETQRTLLKALGAIEEGD